MAYFNMIQCLESAGIGLVYGLRFYSVGSLGENDLMRYLETHALMYEYYRQAQEIVPDAISKVLHRLFTSEAFQIVNTRYSEYSFCKSFNFIMIFYRHYFVSIYPISIFIVPLKFWKMLPSILI